MGQNIFPPEGIIVTAAGVVGATAAGQCVNLTAAQVRSFASVYSQAEVAAAFQPLDATLTALAGVTTAADKVIYATGADTFSTTTLTTFGRSLIDDADAATARTTLGLGTMATQAASSYLALTGGTLTGLLTGTTANFATSLGIGVASPVTPLEVRKDGAVLSGTAYSVLLFRDTTLVQGMNIGYDSATGNGLLCPVSDGDLGLWTFDGTTRAERFRVGSTVVTFYVAAEFASKTKATLPSAAASAKKRYLVTDSTPANRLVFSNGTAWYYEDGTAV